MLIVLLVTNELLVDSLRNTAKAAKHTDAALLQTGQGMLYFTPSTVNR